MQYDKPKVTIDLEEYQYLYNKIKELSEKDEDEDKILLNKAVYVLINNLRPDDFIIGNKLHEAGVTVYIDKHASVREDYQRVKVGRPIKRE